MKTSLLGFTLGFLLLADCLLVGALLRLPLLSKLLLALALGFFTAALFFGRLTSGLSPCPGRRLFLA